VSDRRHCGCWLGLVVKVVVVMLRG
jgi:hypothetical protein